MKPIRANCPSVHSVTFGTQILLRHCRANAPTDLPMVGLPGVEVFRDWTHHGLPPTGALNRGGVQATNFRDQFVHVEDACALAQSIVDTVREPVVVLNEGLRVIAASRSFYAAFKVSRPLFAPAERSPRVPWPINRRHSWADRRIAECLAALSRLRDWPRVVAR
jgi:hypothetical protein